MKLWDVMKASIIDLLRSNFRRDALLESVSIFDRPTYREILNEVRTFEISNVLQLRLLLCQLSEVAVCRCSLK